MTVWDVFAQVKDGEVKNIVVGEAYNVNEVTKAIYGSDALSILVSNPDYPVEIGDTYVDGKFYHNGVEVLARPTDEARLQAVETKSSLNQSAIRSSNTSIDNLWVAVLEG